MIPHVLPPEPPIAYSPILVKKLALASERIGRLDGLSVLLPDVDLLLYFYVRKEAVVSSQIEGTQSTLGELLLFEAGDGPVADGEAAREVSRYVAALRYGLERLRSGFPISLRLIREMHRLLLENGRGSEKMPGEFRNRLVWIGSRSAEAAIYVPPPSLELVTALRSWEAWIHQQTEYDPLIQSALMHVQFESIHPFLDGNGRIGRLLISLLLAERGVMRQPLLYLSLFFKRNRAEYYRQLQAVRMEGAWEEWIEFFLDGVVETATEAVEAARRIADVLDEDRGRVPANHPVTVAVLEALRKRPYMSVKNALQVTGRSQPAVSSAFEELRSLGIVEEITGRSWGRIFGYQRYLAILSEGTEL